MTEQKDLEQALRASEERFRTFLENTNEYVLILQEGKVVYVNSRLKSLSGDLPAITGMPFAGFIHKDDLPFVVESYRKRAEGDATPRSYTIRIVTRKGEIRWVRVNSVPTTWEDRPAVLVAMLDVTDLKQAEEEADKREQQLREVTARVPGVVYQFYARDNGARGLYFVSEGSRQWFGVDPEAEGYFERFIDLVLPEYRQGFLDSIEEAVGSTGEWRYEGRLRKPSGEIIWFSGASAPEKREHEIVFTGVLLDITLQKEAEESLRVREELFRGVFENSPHAMVVQRARDGIYVEVNAAFERLSGYSTTEAIGKSARDLSLVPHEAHNRLTEKIMREGRLHNEPLPVQDRTGNTHHTLVSSALIHLDEPVIVTTAADVTEQRLAEKRLRESERLYRLIAENTADTIWVTDLDLRFTYISPSMERLRGYTVEEALSQTLDQVLTPESMGVIGKMLHEEMETEGGPGIDPGRSRLIEVEEFRKDGSRIWVENVVSFLRDEDLQPVGILGVSRDITHRKRIEEALRGSEKRFRDIAELSPQIIWEADVHGTLTFANKEAERLLGYHRDEMVGRLSIITLFPPDEAERVRANLRRITEGEAVRGNEYTMIHRNGGTFPVIAYTTAIVEEGRITGFRGIVADVSQLKKAEERLRESEAQYRDIFNRAIEGIFRTTPEGRHVSANPALARMLGYDSPEDLLSSVTDIGANLYVDPAERERLKDLIIREGSVRGAEVQLVRRNGTMIWTVINSSAVKDEEGRLVYLQGTIEDITQRKLAEDALRESEKRFRTLIEASPLPILIAREGILIYGNPSFCAIVGMTSSDDLAGRSLLDFVAPEKREEVRGYVSRRLQGEPAPLTYESVGLKEDGTTFPYVVHVATVELADGPITLAFVRDISETKEAERRILESEQSLAATLAASPVGIARVKDRRYEWVNTRSCELTGYERHELEGHNTRFLYPDDEEYIRVGNILYTLGQVETRWVRKDGAVRNILLQAAPTQDGAYIASSMDITDRKTLEAQLFQSQKMEALGTLAGGIAHDFNNILSAIMGYASLLHMKVEREDPLYGYVSQILTSANKASQLVQGLLAFSRKQEMEFKPVLVNEAIMGIQKLLSRLLTEDIELKTIYGADPLAILGDATQLDQVIINLVTNARDALPGGGTITIRTSRFTMESDFVRHHGFGREGDYVLVEVTDTGMGMDDHVKAKIFEPFFTTKAVGKGTGLGLALVYGIMDQHKGFIEVVSAPGKGTSFFLYFPLSSSGLQREGEGKKEVPGGTERILLAEDNTDLRNLLTMVLKDKGYQVIAAVDGLDACRLYEENSVDLVLLDVIMPRMNGKEAYETLKKSHPSIKALFMSGYTDDIIGEKGMIEEGVELLMKPITPAVLLRMVRDVLDKP